MTVACCQDDPTRSQRQRRRMACQLVWTRVGLPSFFNLEIKFGQNQRQQPSAWSLNPPSSREQLSGTRTCTGPELASLESPGLTDCYKPSSAQNIPFSTYTLSLTGRSPVGKDERDSIARAYLDLRVEGRVERPGLTSFNGRYIGVYDISSTDCTTRSVTFV